MTQSMTVAVTGATGFVGSNMVKELLDRGHRVRALARDAARARKALASNRALEVIVGGIHDGDSPAKLVAGCDACIHLIGIIREARGEAAGGDGPQTFRRMHVDATRVI